MTPPRFAHTHTHTHRAQVVVAPLLEEITSGRGELLGAALAAAALACVVHQQGYAGRAAARWSKWGVASVDLTAELGGDMTVEDSGVPRRFLAVLHSVHLQLVSQRLSSDCVSIQVATCLRGAVDDADAKICYLVPVGGRRVAMREGGVRVWVRAAVDERDAGKGSGGGGGGAGGYDEWGDWVGG